MQGVLKRKIFRMIGIVLGSVFGFTGAVFGVLAAMGKFKTPVVYPTILEFAEQEQVVIERIAYDEGVNNATLYSFVISGTNPESKHEVNQKSCYLWFEDFTSSNLIVLCDQYRNPLVPDKNKRYLVNCNEPIYYMVKKVDDNYETDGKVTLRTRSTNDTLKAPDNHLVIWIDREVESVFIKDKSWSEDYWKSTYSTEGGQNKQSITVGVDMSFNLQYAVDTPLSLKPISKEGEKEIELYYVATGYSNDYLRVTKQEIENPNSPLNSLFVYDNEVLKFKTSNPGLYQFYLAVFPTYARKAIYEAALQEGAISNYDKLVINNESDEIYMTLTELNVVVENVEISEAGFLSNGVVLDLYADNNYITLNGVSGVEGANDNNLQLYMKKGTGANSIYDETRFDEVTMSGFAGDVWSTKTPRFVASTATGEQQWDASILSTDIKLTDIHLGEGLTIIDCLQDGAGNKFYCENGVAVLDTNGTPETSDDEIKIIKSGSYLNFYTQSTVDGLTSYNIADFDYSTQILNSHTNKTWNIVAKEIPDDNLCLGILVVNNSGKFYWNNFFKTVDVELNPIELTYDWLEFNSQDVSFNKELKIANFNLTFNDDGTINYRNLLIDNIFTAKTGSYDACVFMVEKSDKNIVNTIDNVTFSKDGKQYVLVGEKDLITGKFINSIRVNDKVANDNKTCKIYLMQLKNGYKQELDDIITETILNDGAVLGTDIPIVALHNVSVDVNAQYVLNNDPDMINVAYYDSYEFGGADNKLTNKLYENSTNKKIVLTSTNNVMFGKIVEFYGINKDSIDSFFTINYSNALQITNVEALKTDDVYNGVMVLTYETGVCLSKPETTPITIDMTVNGVNLSLGSVYVLSGSPEQIIFNYETSFVELAKSSAEAQLSNTYLKVVVSYDDGYSYRFDIYKNGTCVAEDLSSDKKEDIFNVAISSGATLGFQDKVDKNQTLPVNYDVIDKSIFNVVTKPDFAVSVQKSGSTVLSVTIGTETQYLRVVTDASGFNIEAKGSDPASKDFEANKDSIKLDELFKLSYDEDPNEEPDAVPVDKLSVENYVRITNVKFVSYGDGTLTVFPQDDGSWLLKKNKDDTNAILTISSPSNGADGWVFEKANSYITLTISFDIESIADYDKTTEQHDNVTQVRLTFTSSVNVSVNTAWENRTLYAGTQVQLYNADIYSIFNIEGGNDDSIISFGFISSGIEEVVSSAKAKIKDDQIGMLAIKVYYQETATSEKINISPENGFVFNVLPNLFATKKEIVLLSESEYSVDQLYSFKAYEDDDTVTYGSAENILYSNTETYLKPVIPTNVSMGATNISDNNLIITWDATNKQLDLGQLTTLNSETTCNVKVDYTYKIGTIGYIYELADEEFNVKNKYADDSMFTINPHYGEYEYTNNISDDKIIMSLKEYSIFASVVGFDLDSIEADGLEFSVDGTKLKLITEIEEPLGLVDVVLKFTNGIQTLTYKHQLNIVPYVPYSNTSIKTPYSGYEYDLFNEIYNASDIIADGNIKKLEVTAIYDSDSKVNNITSSIIKSGTLTGYTGASNPHCKVVLADFAKDSYDVWVEYRITYTSGNKTYSYLVKLTILNRQEIKPIYPESGATISEGIFMFKEGYEADALKLSGNEIPSADRIYQLKNYAYEAVLVYTDSSTIIDFKYDDVKKHQRISAENRKADDTSNTDLTIELVAWQTRIGDLANGINVNYNTNQISIPEAGIGTFGEVVLRISTDSKNYTHYILYLCCVGSKLGVNAATNLSVAATTTGKANVVKDMVSVKDASTYGDLVESVYGTIVSGKSVFYTTFGVEYDSYTSIYLYNVEVTGDEDASDENITKCVNDTTIGAGQYFKTLTIGLVYNNGVAKYCYGTITIYLQPTNDVSIIDGKIEQFKIGGNQTFNYELPNGYFSADVKADATTIESPFGTDWTAEIVSIDGLKYDRVNNTKHAKYTITASDTSSVLSVVSIGERVSEDTEIIVKYVNAGTIIFVDYNYKRTVVPDQAELNKQTFTVGNFDTSKGFVNTINLASETNRETFFGTYSLTSGYEITTDNEYANSNRSGTTLTFELKTVRYEVKVTITYTNLDAKDKTRVFTFIVQQGFAQDEDSLNNNSGLSSSSRLQTKTDISDVNYNSQKGSYIAIETPDVSGKNYYSYKIGEYIIYTAHQSQLSLTFDVNDYALIYDEYDAQYRVLQAGESIHISGAGNVFFVHSAINKAVIMTVEILNMEDDNNKYSQRNIYLTVTKTYDKLEANYLADNADNADHENIKSYNIDGGARVANKIEDLHNVLLGGNRFGLVGASSADYSLTNMGFATVGNPNYIDFSVNENAILNDAKTELTFAIVATNTMCVVYLNNDAGMEANAVTYNYQIMASNSDDGLNYSVTNGHYDENGSDNYISFIMKDTNVENSYSNENHQATDTDKPFVIGKMLDERNDGQFKVDELKINESSAGIREYTNIINNGLDENGDKCVGGYQTAIQYVYKYPYDPINYTFNYTFYITYNIENGLVELIVKREPGVDELKDLLLTISLSGVNQHEDGTVVENLNIYLSKDQAFSNFEDRKDTTIYAGDIIHLFNDGKFTENGGSSATLTYEMAESSYVADGKTTNLSKADTNNKLFKYEQNLYTITTKAVGCRVEVVMNFVVKKDNYVLKTISYNFIIALNMQIVVNGELLNENKGNSQPTTNFVLTNVKDAVAKGFPLTYNFISGYDLSGEDNVATSSSTGTSYYNALAFDLYNVRIQDNLDAEQEDKLLPRSVVKVYMYDSIDTDIVTITNSGITFNRDYTGDITLKLVVEGTQVGSYSIIWTISVTGFIDLQYANITNPTTSKLQTDQGPFNSGDTVKLINNDAGTGVGVTLDSSNYFTDDINFDYDGTDNNSTSDNKGFIKAVYEYKINENNAELKGLTNQGLFELNDSTYNKGSGKGDAQVSGSQLSLTLPNVPSTQGSQSYWVTYKLYVEYLGLDEAKVEVFYVTYVVINRQVVTPVNANINVDDIKSEDGEGNAVYNLKLFTYKQSGKATIEGVAKDIMLTYTNDKIELRIGDETYYYGGNTGRYNFYDAGGVLAYYLDLSSANPALYSSSEDLITTKDWAVESDNGTVFNSGFTNIFEFKNFIDTYTKESSSVRLTKGSEEFDFTLKEISDGVYGIDLMEYTKDYGKVLFTNEMRAELALIDNSVKTITIAPYSETYSAGFRLYTDNSISAVSTKKLSTMFLRKNLTVESGSDVTINTPIIGIGSDPSNYYYWVTNGTPSETTAKCATLSVSDLTQYEVHKVTYKLDVDENALYSIEQDFYFIKASEVVVPDYSIGIQTSFFSVPYGESLDLTQAIKVWTMAEDGKSFVSVSASSFTEDACSCADDSITITGILLGNKIALTETVLNNYKRENPTATVYPTITATITADGATLTFEIEFMLYEYVKVGCEYNPASGELTVNLTNGFYVPLINATNGNVTYQALTETNASKVLSIEGDYVSSYSDGVLTLDVNAVGTYFEDKSDPIVVVCRLYTADGQMDFELTISKTA